MVFDSPRKKYHTNIFPEWSVLVCGAHVPKYGGRYYNNNSLLDGFYYITLVVASTRTTDVRRQRHACRWMVDLDMYLCACVCLCTFRCVMFANKHLMEIEKGKASRCLVCVTVQMPLASPHIWTQCTSDVCRQHKCIAYKCKCQRYMQ